MDVVELLEAATLLTPEETATDNDLTVRDVWDLLAHDEWETALTMLEGAGNARPLPLAFWERLADAARQLHLDHSTAWCHWRASEIRNGMIRADLTLGARGAPVPGHGILRPVWDIGNLSPTGEPAVNVAALWLENTRSLAPGDRATARLVPLTPTQWQHVRPGRRITMHEGRPAIATAVVTEVHLPTTP
ncbi:MULTISPECIES: hypothetical protein [unclassified Streptomyces]|uniref:hypothetical protein n=1 Tax=Streptomyces TaxID=1883 RepID=UPI0006AED356|nr:MULTISPECIES: hypothetical protein [unclassified Streptomyces]KOU11236.1 hypothetical protein ADK49_30265 [Streptomyces sp. WM6349]KOV38982.1 hypothetical protein ADK98_33550 [Streptomyces sp. H036]QNE27843.1 hypothetical protein F1D59_26360 [Streptomyces sp. INR7]